MPVRNAGDVNQTCLKVPVRLPRRIAPARAGATPWSVCSVRLRPSEKLPSCGLRRQPVTCLNWPSDRALPALPRGISAGPARRCRRPQISDNGSSGQTLVPSVRVLPAAARPQARSPSVRRCRTDADTRRRRKPGLSRTADNNRRWFRQGETPMWETRADRIQDQKSARAVLTPPTALPMHHRRYQRVAAVTCSRCLDDGRHPFLIGSDAGSGTSNSAAGSSASGLTAGEARWLARSTDCWRGQRQNQCDRRGRRLGRQRAKRLLFCMRLLNQFDSTPGRSRPPPVSAINDCNCARLDLVGQLLR